MAEVVFYRLSNMVNLVLMSMVFLAFSMMFIYKITQSEKIDGKTAKIYGLLMNLKNIDVFMLTMNIIKMLTIIYVAFSNGKDIMMYIIMLVILNIPIFLYNFKKIIFEVINCVTPIIVLYLISILNSYAVEVENNTYVGIIKIVLIIFICFYAIYIFLSYLEDMSNKNIRRSLNEKK